MSACVCVWKGFSSGNLAHCGILAGCAYTGAELRNGLGQNITTAHLPEPSSACPIP